MVFNHSFFLFQKVFNKVEMKVANIFQNLANFFKTLFLKQKYISIKFLRKVAKIKMKMFQNSLFKGVFKYNVVSSMLKIEK